MNCNTKTDMIISSIKESIVKFVKDNNGNYPVAIIVEPEDYNTLVTDLCDCNLGDYSIQLRQYFDSLIIPKSFTVDLSKNYAI